MMINFRISITENQTIKFTAVLNWGITVPWSVVTEADETTRPSFFSQFSLICLWFAGVVLLAGPVVLNTLIASMLELVHDVNIKSSFFLFWPSIFVSQVFTVLGSYGTLLGLFLLPIAVHPKAHTILPSFLFLDHIYFICAYVFITFIIVFGCMIFHLNTGPVVTCKCGLTTPKKIISDEELIKGDAYIINKILREAPKDLNSNNIFKALVKLHVSDNAQKRLQRRGSTLNYGSN